MGVVLGALAPLAVPFSRHFGGELPLLTACRGTEALKVHFRCICDGLLFRRFRPQVPGDPK
jgi:hypothetical protein